MKKSETIETGAISKAVLYTDGSARPFNPGYRGWSVHGYLFSDKQSKKGIGHPKVIPTQEGYAAKDKSHKTFLDVQQYYDYVGWSKDQASNNTSEILGCSQALSFLSTRPEIKHATIYSDSRYVVDGVNKYITQWVANDFIKKDGSEVANKEEWKTLLKNLTKATNNGCQIKIEWVKGHSDNFGNHIADHHASIGSHIAETKNNDGHFEKTTSALGYWKNELQSHPMIGHRGVLFVSNKQSNLPGEYYQCNQLKSHEFIGRGQVSAGYGYCKIKQPDVLIEAVRNHQLKHARSFNTLFLIRVDRVYDKSVGAMLEMFGDGVLVQKHHQRQDLYFANESLMAEYQRRKQDGQSKLIPVVEELYPPLLAYRAALACSKLKDLCGEIKGFYEKDQNLGLSQPFLFKSPKEHLVFDVTSEYYDKVTEKKKTSLQLKKEIDVSLKSLNINRHAFGKDRRFQFVFRTHLPSRNKLKKLDATDVRVWMVVLKDSDYTFRYYTVIKSDEDWSAWMARDSNLLIDKPLSNLKDIKCK